MAKPPYMRSYSLSPHRTMAARLKIQVSIKQNVTWQEDCSLGRVKTRLCHFLFCFLTSDMTIMYNKHCQRHYGPRR